jgi:hypothetical protein
MSMTGGKAERPFVWLLMCQAPLALWAMIEQATSRGPAEMATVTSMANPNLTAGVLLAAALGLLSLGFERPSGERRLPILVGLLIVLGLLATACKTGVASLGVGLALVLFARWAARLKRWHWVAILGCVTLLPALLGLVCEPARGLLQIVGLSGRAELWRAALGVASTHWPAGTGFGLWQPLVVGELAHRTIEHGYKPFLHVPQALYSDPLQLLLEAGLVPWVFFLLMTADALRRAYSSPNPVARAAGTMIGGLTVFGLCQDPLGNPGVALFWWLSLGLVWGSTATGERIPAATFATVWRPALRRAVVSIWACLAAACAYQSVRLAAGLLETLESRHHILQPSVSLQHADRATWFLPENAEAWLWQAERCRSSGTYRAALSAVGESLERAFSFRSLILQGSMVEQVEPPGMALRFWSDSSAKYPWLITPRYRAAILYSRQGDASRARETCAAAEAISASSEEQRQAQVGCRRMRQRLDELQGR